MKTQVTLTEAPMDAISMAAGSLGVSFLEEAVKFLWSEAGKILDRFHARRQKRADAAADLAKLEGPVPANLGLSTVRTIDFAIAALHVDELTRLRGELSGYVLGTTPIAASDSHLLARADALQARVAAILRQPLPVPTIDSHLSIGTVEASGSVTGVELAGDAKTSVRQEVDVASVKGEITGVRLQR